MVEILLKVTEDTPGILRSAVPLLSATLVMWLAAFAFERPVEIPQLEIAWLGILGSGFEFILAFYLIHEIGPTRTSMVSHLFPPGRRDPGVTFLGEELSWQLITGMVLIIASLAIANWQPAKRPAADRAERANRAKRAA